MYVMEPDVSGGSGLFYSKLSHTSMLGVAHVMGKCKVGSDDAIDASVVDNYYNVDETMALVIRRMRRDTSRRLCLSWGRFSSTLLVNARSVRKMEKVTQLQ